MKYLCTRCCLTVVLYFWLEDPVIGKPVDDWPSRVSNISSTDPGEGHGTFDTPGHIETAEERGEGDDTSVSGREAETHGLRPRRVEMFNMSDVSVPQMTESDIAPHMNESETTPHMKESETTPHMKESATTPHMKESDTAPHMKESDTAPHMNGSETEHHTNESESMSHTSELELVSYMSELETAMHMNESETEHHSNESEPFSHTSELELVSHMSESESVAHMWESETDLHMSEDTEEPTQEAVYDDEDIPVQKKSGAPTAENREHEDGEHHESQQYGEGESPMAGPVQDNVTVLTGVVTGHPIPDIQPTDDGLKTITSDVSFHSVDRVLTTPTSPRDPLTTDAPNEVQFISGQNSSDPDSSVNVGSDSGRVSETNNTQVNQVPPIDYDITADEHNTDDASNNTISSSSSSDRADNTDGGGHHGGGRRPGEEISGVAHRGNLSDAENLTPGVGPQIQQTEDASLAGHVTQPYLESFPPTGNIDDDVKRDPSQLLPTSVSPDTGNTNSGAHDMTHQTREPSSILDVTTERGGMAETSQESVIETLSPQVSTVSVFSHTTEDPRVFPETTSTTSTTESTPKDSETTTASTTTEEYTTKTKSPSFVEETTTTTTTTTTTLSDVAVSISDTTSLTHTTTASTTRSTTSTSSFVSPEDGAAAATAKSAKTTFSTVESYTSNTQMNTISDSSISDSSVFASTESTLDYPPETLVPDLHLPVDGPHAKPSPHPTPTDKTPTQPSETRPLSTGETSTVSHQSSSIIKIPDRLPTSDNVNCTLDQRSTGSNNVRTLAEGESSRPSIYMILALDISWSTYCKSRDGIKTDIIKVMSNGTTPVNSDQIEVLDLDKCQCSDSSPEIQLNVFLLNKTKTFDHDLTQRCARVLQNLIGSNCSFVILNRLRSVVVNGETRVGHVSVSSQDSSLLSDPGVTVAIVLAVVGGCCCIALISLQVIVRRRNKDGLSLKPNLKRSSSWSSDSIRLSSINKSRPNSGLFNPGLDITDMLEPSRPLNYTQLSNYCCNTKKIEEEFQTLPLKMPRLSVVPLGEEDKNRYANVLPLTHTRVKIFQDGPEQRGTYINANYVTGPNSQCQYYIATQAPTNETMADFWTMVWQQNSKAIVMLTQLEEDGQSKCVLYWPELVGKSAALKIGDFLIELKQKDVHQEYIISKFEVQHLRKIEKREVYHFWYTCWPSHGLPEPISLVKLVLDTRPKYEDGMAPLIVHCSPGTGRTGTFIALDLCMRQFETHRMVDVLKTVFLIRQERAGAIQSKEQYFLLYNAISEYATVVVSPVVSAASSATTLHALLSS